MAGGNRRAGIIYLRIDGTLQEAKGEFTYDLGAPQRNAIVGADGIHGYSETSKQAYIEGAITDSSGLDLARLVELDDVDVTLELNNGKTILLPAAWYAGSGQVTTSEAQIPVRFESRRRAQEI